MKKVNVNPDVLIDFFDFTEYDWLSNFYPAPITYRGLRYPTSEHAFQSIKMAVPFAKETVRLANSPDEAKALGRTLLMRDDWSKIRVQVMFEIVLAKFEQYPTLTEKLLATGNAELVEGNTWNDKIWGVVNGVGENNLGKILMDVREILRIKKKYAISSARIDSGRF